MGMISKTLGAVACLGIGALAATVTILGVQDTSARATEFGTELVESVGSADVQFEGVRFDACRKRYLKNTSCYQVFSPEACEEEVSKACDPSAKNYHGKVPSPLRPLKEG